MSDTPTTTTEIVANPQQSTVVSATRPKGLRDWLQAPEFKEQLSLACGDAIKPEHFLRVAITAMNKNPKLLECTKESVFRCMLDSAAFGVELNGRDAHLIPYGREATLIIDYKGYVRLVMNTGLVSNIHADVVCENDDFEYNLGEVKRHVIDFKKPRGAVYAVYCIVTMKDGTKKAEVMSNDDVEAIRKRSRSGNSGPWITDRAEMAKKGLALDTRIPTPAGWTTMGEIKAGDTVFDMHGAQVCVLGVSEIKNLDCYKVTFSNGDSVICDHEHRWIAAVGGNESSKARKSGVWPVYEAAELAERKRAGESIVIPVNPKLDTPHANLPIDPWLLGYWLGNGNSYNPSLTCHLDDADYVSGRVSCSKYTLGKVCRDKRSKAVTVRIKGGMLNDLREMGLLQNKHVPDIYMRSSPQQRMELLRGMMDSDGCVEKVRGRAIFGSVNEALSDAVYELATSLGETANRSTRIATGYGKEVLFHSVGWQPSAAPVSLPRKLKNFKKRKLVVYRSIKAIEKIPSVPTRCIAVDSPTSSYLAGESMAPTHNTVFRRLQKWLPLSPEVQEKLDKDMRTEFAELADSIRQRPRQNFLTTMGDAAATETDEPPFSAEEGKQ